MSLVTLHVAALTVWAIVVAIEVTFESAAILGRLEARTAAIAHRWTDRLIEAPLLAIVAGTGAVLWWRTGFDPSLFPKVGCGLGAVAANAVCVGIVERRAASATPAALTPYVSGTAVVGIPLAAVALALGGARAGWW